MTRLIMSIDKSTNDAYMKLFEDLFDGGTFDL